MSTPPTIIPLKRRVRRKRRAQLGSSPPPSAVTVVSVSVVDSATLQWTFSANIATLDSNVEQLLASVPDGFQGPSGVSQVGPSMLWAAYPDGDFSSGGTWQVDEEVIGVTFAGGGVVGVPESGSI